nr:MAG: RNA-dependent RNA polymerase [Sclerotinia sclerotiorum ourmia-like virus 5]
MREPRHLRQGPVITEGGREPGSQVRRPTGASTTCRWLDGGKPQFPTTPEVQESSNLGKLNICKGMNDRKAVYRARETKRSGSPRPLNKRDAEDERREVAAKSRRENNVDRIRDDTCLPVVKEGDGIRRHYLRCHKRNHLISNVGYRCLCRDGFHAGKLGNNPYSILYNLDSKTRDAPLPITSCTRKKKYAGKCKKIVKLLGVEQNLKPINRQPKNITCGTLRASVRSMYAQELTLVQELSIKTSMKVESQPCDFCEEHQESNKMEQWKRERTKETPVSDSDLAEFGIAFRNNVPQGWNKRKSPYVPNGHATKECGRRDGGNWNSGVFDDQVEIVQVHSSGKPRIVTLYSEHNVRTLTPLHNSLFSFLKGRNWLLVGSPTSERLRYLSEGCEGKVWHSFDYVSATDNIKTAYVQRAVEILIDKGEGLSEDEERCMRVMSRLSIEGTAASTGQPMGSPLSFPLLCLINKTVVDLALTDLLIEGKIEFKEWTRHRCLINGDDLLTKGTSSGDLVACVARRGAQIGLVTNREKTMSSPEYAEINSSVFKNCTRQKKTNVAALWMGADVPDVLGYANESCVSGRGFRMVVTNNASRLARNKIKTCVDLPFARKEILMSSKRLKTALMSRPSCDVPNATNLFPVVPVPAGYDLTREEENATLEREVEKAREKGVWRTLYQEKKQLLKRRRAVEAIAGEGKFRGIMRTLKVKKNHSQETTLAVFVNEWYNKQRNRLIGQEPMRFTFTSHGPLNPFTAPLSEMYGLSSISAFQVMIKSFKDKRKGVRPIPSDLPSGRCPFSENDGYVSLTDV